MTWTFLCEFTDLRVDQGKYVEVAGFQLAVFLHAGRVYAMDNHCPHAGANLSGGTVYDGCAVCPKHNWPFRLDDGQLKDIPDGPRVEVYPTRVLEREGQPPLVEVQLP